MVVAFVLASHANAQCLKVDQEEYAEGSLAERLFSDAAGRPEPAFILTLPASVCLRGEDEMDNVEGAPTIQIYGTNSSVDRSISRSVGQRVQVSGKPFGAMTVHHHAPIIMEVSRIWTSQGRLSGNQQIFRPKRGSGLRAELLDAARPTFEEETGGPIEFVVRRLNVLGDWAFGEVELQRPGGAAINWARTKYADDYAEGMFDPSGTFFLLRNAGSRWEVVEFATGPTDIAWDSWRHDYSLPLALFQR
jgi:hypothetical protein